ncbi:MAG: protocatechuate 3,4-dioxygenase subunit alpha, partial [Bryobacteraceae bacterium]
SMTLVTANGREYRPYDDRTQPPRWIDDYPRTKLRTPREPLIPRPLTLSERTGPTALEKKLTLGPDDMSRPFPDRPKALGQYASIEGRVLDEDGKPVPGALIEFWQANTSGKYIHELDTNDATVDPNFVGATRQVTDSEGRYHFRTVIPGAYPVTASTWEWRAPHIHVSIFGDSWLSRLITQLFVPGHPILEQDLLLNSIPDPAARERLIIRMKPTKVRPTGNILEFEQDFVIRGHDQTPTLVDHDDVPSEAGPFASMTTGPFFPPALIEPSLGDLTQFDGRLAQGKRILLTGRVLEKGLNPTVNSIVEIWQADHRGVFRHPLDPRHVEADPGFAGWGRNATNREGWYRFETVMPGSYAGEDGRPRVAHINAMVLASGILRPLLTTVFFGEDKDDPVLRCVTDAERRKLLFAVRDPSLNADGVEAYRFDIVLRGERETPFFLD